MFIVIPLSLCPLEKRSETVPETAPEDYIGKHLKASGFISIFK